MLGPEVRAAATTLDVSASMFVCNLDQFARGDIGIGENVRLDEFHDFGGDGAAIICRLFCRIISSGGTPCRDRRVMCAPENKHSQDMAEEPRQSLASHVATRTISSVTAPVPDLAQRPPRQPQE